MSIKSLVLLSGGIDSTTCLAIAKKNNEIIHTLSIDYGQKHSSELAAAEKLAQTFGSVDHTTYQLDSKPFSGSSLTDESIKVPEHSSTKEVKSTYVPVRNLVLLSVAFAMAKAKTISKIYFGANKADIDGFPDARPGFIESFVNTANLAAQTDDQSTIINIATPLLQLTKPEILSLGLSLGVDFAETVTCYSATLDGKACGKCDSCKIRKDAFLTSGLTDTTRYIK